MIDTLLSFIAPHSCCSCGDIGRLLCQSCKYDIITEGFCVCVLCEKPTQSSAICGRCRLATGITDAWCVGYREGSLKALLDAYKFRSSREASGYLAELLDAALPFLPEDIVITWVPTAPSHVRTRGMDHTRRVATRLAKQRGYTVGSYLERTSGDMQHLKTRRQRLRDADKNIISTRTAPDTVIIIDDILTTGATMTACVKKLRSAGSKQIYVAIAARQPGWESQNYQ